MDEIYVPQPWEKIEGWYFVTFVNGDKKQIEVKANVITSDSRPLYLVDVNDVIYNWMTIISIKKEN